jgi:hypothetical protein
VSAYPDIADREAVKRYFAEHPIEGLTSRQINDEARHWEDALEAHEREEAKETTAAKAGQGSNRWSVLDRQHFAL